MATEKSRSDRRTDALTRERIVAAAIEVLDSEGEGAQLFRALASRLSTGMGAIYHHVANKSELLSAAADAVLSPALAPPPTDTDPRESIRAISLGVFDAIDTHPWLGTQLSREPWQPAVLKLWMGVGQQLDALDIAGPARSDAGAALVNYVLGAAAQYAAGPRSVPLAADREAFLADLALQLGQQDPDAASQLVEHDDRQQFLAGVDIFLAGIIAVGR